MKNYYFEFTGYGDSYHVMDKNPKEALWSVKRFLNYNIEDEDSQLEYDLWKDATLESLPKGYTLRELREGEVIKTCLQ